MTSDVLRNGRPDLSPGIYRGVLKEVVEGDGTGLFGAHAAGATTLSVAAGAFRSEGSCRIDGETYAYTRDGDTLTITPPLVAAAEDGEPVESLTPAGEPEVSLVAVVDLDMDGDPEGDPHAVIPGELAAFYQLGDAAAGALVDVRDTAYGYEVTGRPTDTPAISQQYVEVPVLSIDLSANQSIPSGGSPTVVTGWESGPSTVLGYFRRPTLDVSFGVSSIALSAPGGYYVQATVDWGANTSGGRTATLVFSRDGVDVDSTQVVGAPSPETGRTTQQVSRVFVAEGNETVRVEVRQSSGGSLNVLAAATNIQVARFAA